MTIEIGKRRKIRDIIGIRDLNILNIKTNGKLFFRVNNPDELVVETMQKDDSSIRLFTGRKGSSPIFTVATIYPEKKLNQVNNRDQNCLVNHRRDATRTENPSFLTQSPHLSSASMLNRIRPL